MERGEQKASVVAETRRGPDTKVCGTIEVTFAADGSSGARTIESVSNSIFYLCQKVT